MGKSVVAAIGGTNLQARVLGADLLPRLAWQDTSGTWFGYGLTGVLPNQGSLSNLSIGVCCDNQLVVVGIGAIDRRPYVITQNAAGAWSFAGSLL